MRKKITLVFFMRFLSNSVDGGMRMHFEGERIQVCLVMKNVVEKRSIRVLSWTMRNSVLFFLIYDQGQNVKVS